MSMIQNSAAAEHDPDVMTVVYDGQCPFCTNYVSLMNIRRSVGKVALVDARENSPIVKMLADEGYDLDEGMAVVFGDRVYYGEDAVTFISSLADRTSLASRLIAALLANPNRAAALYPIMKRGRRIALNLLGRPRL
jgi:predicted DCC family thiol-disulfide oxidoreductase YuxK